MKNTQIIASYALAKELDSMTKELEGLTCGKDGFLKEMRKTIKDAGIQQLHIDIFILKQMTKHVSELLAYARDLAEGEQVEEVSEEDAKFNKEQCNKSGSVYGKPK